MAVMTLAQLIAQADLMAAQYVDLRDDLGDEAIEEPSDDTGTRGMIGDQHTTAKAYSGDDWDAFLVACKADANAATVQEVGPDIFGERMDALQDLAADAGLSGVTTLTSFLTYYNQGAGAVGIGDYYTGLMAPAFARGVYNLTEGANLDAENVYSPVIASLATKVVGGAFTHVADVDTAKYAGAARAMLTVSGRSGTGTAIVTGTARTADGSLVAGRTWTCEITDSNATLLVPQNAGDLLCIVSAISLDAGISAGTATVSCAVPSGRTEYLN